MKPTIIRINSKGSLSWRVQRTASGAYFAECEVLALWALGDTYSEVQKDMAESIDQLFAALFSANALENYLSKVGWTFEGVLPEVQAEGQPATAVFDVVYAQSTQDVSSLNVWENSVVMWCEELKRSACFSQLTPLIEVRLNETKILARIERKQISHAEARARLRRWVGGEIDLKTLLADVESW